MKQIISRLKALPLHLALFDDPPAGGGAGDGSNGGGGGAAGGDNDARGGGGAGGGGGSFQRNNRGQFSRSGDGSGDRYPNDIAEAHRMLSDQETRIAQLNEENKNRRIENKDLTKKLDTVQSRQSLVDQRAIRAEARDALRGAGVIDPDVVDLFLKHAGQNIKIDETTGDVVGVGESLAKFKESKPVFFTPAANGGDGGDGSGGDGSGKGAGNGDGSNNGDAAGKNAGSGANNQGGGKTGDGDNRGNATGKGSSVAGGGSGGDGSFKVANFRDPGVDADKALDNYMKTLR